MATTLPQRFSLFVEGVRVPCEFCRVVQAPDRGATARIHLPPSDVAFHAPERSLVHLFFEDRTQDPPLWRRLFEGEITQKGIHYEAGTRMAVYDCQDDTVYWRQTFRDFLQVGSALTEALNLGAEVPVQFFTQSVDGRTTAFPELVEVANLLWPDGAATLRQRLEGVFDQVAEINAYYQASDRRLKLRNRLAVVETATGNTIINRQQEAIRRQLFSTRGRKHVTLWTLIGVLIDRLRFQLVSNPAPPYRRAAPGQTAEPLSFQDLERVRQGLGWVPQHVMMPELTWAPPVRCNVLLPPMVDTFRYNDNFLNGATRTVARVVPGEGAQTLIYAPPELRGEDGLGLVDGSFTDEESFRGYVPQEITVGPSEFIGPDPKNEQQWQELQVKAVNYRHWRSVFSARNANGSGPFNPWLVAGLPAAVVDSVYGLVAGDLSQVVHAIQLHGNATTSFMLDRCRHVSTPASAPYVPEYRRDREINPPTHIFPEADQQGVSAWLDGRFTPDRIGEHVYKPMLGYDDPPYGSILETVEQEGGEERLETVLEALTRVRDTFTSQTGPAQEQLARQYSRREIATLAETFFLLGARPRRPLDKRRLTDLDPLNDNEEHWPVARALASPAWENPGPNPEDPSAWRGPFVRERQQWAEAYRAEMAQLPGVLNDDD